MKPALFRLLLAWFVFSGALSTFAQSQQDQIPPGIMRAQRADEKSRAEMPPPLPPHRTVSPDDLKRDAAELARLSQLVPGEIEALNKGVLNKDLESQLKQIEKLSKKLRQEVHP